MNLNIPSSSNSLLPSFFIGGYECSTHRLHNGKRLDLTASTQHDRFVAQDYERLKSVGMLTAREAFRWHLIESEAGKYDFSSALPMLRAARQHGIKVIWDLLHFGWPDHIDIFAADFVARFQNFTRAVIRVLEEEGESAPYIAPINEISFFSWAAGGAGFFNPFVHDRGDELKRQLVSAAIGATRLLQENFADARIFHIDPIINIAADVTRPQDRIVAEGHRQSQFQVWDMICGRRAPELGGKPQYLDVIGANYYSNNQWIHNGSTLGPSSPYYVRLRYMLRELHLRYGRPVFLSETGIEDEARPAWLRYIGQEARATRNLGVPLEGVCLYPILNHPGWDNDRHCYNGLWDYADESGHRAIYAPLARELAHQQELWAQDSETVEEVDVHSLDAAATAIEEATARARGTS